MYQVAEKRLEELKVELQKAQETMQIMNQEIEKQKAFVIQLMGHFNEASYFYEECRKLNEGAKNGEEVDARCSETGEQGQAA